MEQHEKASVYSPPLGFMDPGPCPKAAPLATFDALEFSGDWYMISFKPNMMESATLQCRFDYALFRGMSIENGKNG